MHPYKVILHFVAPSLSLQDVERFCDTLAELYSNISKVHACVHVEGMGGGKANNLYLLICCSSPSANSGYLPLRVQTNRQHRSSGESRGISTADYIQCN